MIFPDFLSPPTIWTRICNGPAWPCRLIRQGSNEVSRCLRTIQLVCTAYCVQYDAHTVCINCRLHPRILLPAPIFVFTEADGTIGRIKKKHFDYFESFQHVGMIWFFPQKSLHPNTRPYCVYSTWVYILRRFNESRKLRNKKLSNCRTGLEIINIHYQVQNC